MKNVFSLEFPYLSSNLKKIKFIFISILLIALIIQLFLIDDFKNFDCLIYLTISNLLIYFYCFKENTIKKYPISNFSLIFINIYSNSGALYFKSFTLESVKSFMYQPNITFFYLLLFNFFMIIIHIFYRNFSIFYFLKKYFNKFFLLFEKNQILDKKCLLYLGFFSILIGSLGITFLNKYIWSDKAIGPSLFGDLINGIKVFYVCPFILLFTKKFYEFQINKKEYLIIIICSFLIVYLSLGLNSRSVFFDILFTGVLIYLLLVLVGFIEIKVLRFNKLVIIFILLIFISNFIDKFSKSYLKARQFRDNTNPIQNIINHYQLLKIKNSSVLINVNDRNSNKIFNENYYNINFLNRINVSQLADNIFYAKNFMHKKEIEAILDYEKKKFLGILPSPLIKIFNPYYNKAIYFDTVTSQIYSKIEKFSVGGKSNGIIFSILIFYESYLFYTIFFLATLLVFSILDSFVSKNNISILLFILLYATSGGLINVIAGGSLFNFIANLFRDFPQSILILFIFGKFFKNLLIKV